ncbi:MAG: alpha/beta hydrolase-fold protein, partial [Clostridia bacterium]|nr:alpha/beta hydrolase-fold protein [Clostridia bacterium]
SQSREDKSIVDIKVEDPSQLDTPAFKTDVSEYEMNVIADTYGIRFTVYGDGPFTINGDIVEAGEQWIVDFPQEQENMRTQHTRQVVIEGEGQTYTYTIAREELSLIYDEFELRTWQLDDGAEMYYWLYLPRDYDAAREYPVVLYLHGGGQRTQDPEMILMRNRAATAFALAEEDCIIVAPQCNYTDLSSSESWVSGVDLKPSIFGDATVDIVKSVMSEFSCDEKRVSITGLSMGCTGSLGVASAHPGVFSAILCATPTIEDATAIRALADNKIPVRFVLCATDPNPNKLRTLMALHAAVDQYNVQWDETIYWSNVFIYPTQHFSWEIMYADAENINWLISCEKNM